MSQSGGFELPHGAGANSEAGMLAKGKRARRGITALYAAVAIGVCSLQVASPGKASAATPDPYDSLTGNVQLTSDIMGNLGKITNLGAINPAQTLYLGVALSRPDPAGEDAYIADVYNPASANYGHFLTTAGWQARFGVAAARYNRAASWLQSGGLTTAPIAGSSEYILAQGTAAQVEALLQVQINNYTQTTTTTLFGDVTNFYANANVPTAPANLGALSIAGLQNFERMRTMYEVHQAAIARGLYAPDTTPTPAATHTGSTTPQDLWDIYHQPTNNRGRFERMAIFGWGCTEPTDSAACSGADVINNLRGFESTYSLPPMPISINHYGLDPINDNSALGEWTLDLPASTGMAPDANSEQLYFGNSGSDPDILSAYNAWVADPNAPRQGSSSFAGCEATPLTNSQPGGPGNPPTGPGSTAIGNPNQDAYESVLKAAVALGYTMFNSTGDLGANGCPYSFTLALNGVTPTATQINNYPSSSNYVTAVSGTVLYWTGGHGDVGPATRFLEYSWTHSGGGTSLFISAPAWQQASSFHTNNTSAPGVTAFCATDWHTMPNAYPPGTFCKGVPDVTAQSGDVLTNGYVAGGGTSLSSPLWLGMWTRIQAASSNPGRLGFATPLIYANNANATKYESDFFDVGGTNPAYNPGHPNSATLSSCEPLPGPYSCSGSGWDYASGWGSPDVTNLMKDLDNGNTNPVAFIPVSTPEAPVTVLMVAAGLAAVAGAIEIRRRRRVRA